MSEYDNSDEMFDDFECELIADFDEVVSSSSEDEVLNTEVPNDIIIEKTYDYNIFYECIINNEIDEVKLYLSDLDFNPGAENNKALRIAYDNGNFLMFSLLLSSPKVDPSTYNNYIFKNAIKNQSHRIIGLLLKDNRIDINFEDSYPIRVASSNGYLYIVLLLIEYGSKITEKSVICAIRNGDINVVKALYQHYNGNINNLIEESIYSSNDEITKFLIETYENVCCDKILRIAMENRNFDIGNMVLEKFQIQADLLLEYQHLSNESLIYAIRNGDINVAKALHQHYNGNINNLMEDCIRSSNEDITKLFIEKFDIIDSNAIFDMSMESKKFDICQILLEKFKISNNLLLEYYCFTDNIDKIKQLCDNGTNVNKSFSFLIGNILDNNKHHILKILLQSAKITPGCVSRSIEQYYQNVKCYWITYNKSYKVILRYFMMNEVQNVPYYVFVYNTLYISHKKTFDVLKNVKFLFYMDKLASYELKKNNIKPSHEELICLVVNNCGRFLKKIWNLFRIYSSLLFISDIHDIPKDVLNVIMTSYINLEGYVFSDKECEFCTRLWNGVFMYRNNLACMLSKLDNLHIDYSNELEAKEINDLKDSILEFENELKRNRYVN